jgi:hypothetical protein
VEPTKDFSQKLKTALFPLAKFKGVEAICVVVEETASLDGSKTLPKLNTEVLVMY